jgi:RNA polymerase sigma-70 factor (ECF subfamily)
MTVATDQPTDSQLVAAWRGGDEAAAATLVRRHAGVLGRYLVSRGATSAEVDDLLQETFFRAFRGLGGWRGDAPFRGWLFRIAANLVRDRFRRSGGRIQVELVDADRIDSADPAAVLEADEVANQLRDGLARLSPTQREVFLLRVEQGLDYREIAAALGTTAGAARVHYHHAVRRMKERLG